MEKITLTNWLMTKQEEEDIIMRFSSYAREVYDIVPEIRNSPQYVTQNTSDDRVIFIRKITEPLSENPHTAHFYTCSDWLFFKWNIVASRLQHFLGKSKKLHGRDCEVKRIDANTAANFLEQTHLHGPLTGKYKYGLFHKKLSLVGVATFAQARNFKKEERTIVSSEMLALSFALGYSVVGGFQKLLQAHIRERRPDEIMTYSDLDLGKVNIYMRTEFESRGTGEPRIFSHDESGNRIYSIQNTSNQALSFNEGYQNQGFEKWVLPIQYVNESVI
jgi:hypothetical protein